MFTMAKKKTMAEYVTPIETMVLSAVNRARKPGMMAVASRVHRRPWSTERAMPWVAAASALSWSPAPR